MKNNMIRTITLLLFAGLIAAFVMYRSGLFSDTGASAHASGYQSVLSDEKIRELPVTPEDLHVSGEWMEEDSTDEIVVIEETQEERAARFRIISSSKSMMVFDPLNNQTESARPYSTLPKKIKKKERKVPELVYKLKSKEKGK